MLEIPDRLSGCGCWVGVFSMCRAGRSSVCVVAVERAVLFDVCRSDVQRKVEERSRISFEVKVIRSCQ
jgi:hypothetical protein